MMTYRRMFQLMTKLIIIKRITTNHVEGQMTICVVIYHYLIKQENSLNATTTSKSSN